MGPSTKNGQNERDLRAPFSPPQAKSNWPRARTNERTRCNHEKKQLPVGSSVSSSRERRVLFSCKTVSKKRRFLCIILKEEEEEEEEE